MVKVYPITGENQKGLFKTFTERQGSDGMIRYFVMSDGEREKWFPMESIDHVAILKKRQGKKNRKWIGLGIGLPIDAILTYALLAALGPYE